MSITKYFVGGEVEAFVQGSYAGLTWSTTAGVYDSDFSRGAVGFSTTSDAYLRAPLTSAQTTCWVSMQHWLGSGGTGQVTANVWMEFCNASLAPIYRIMGIGGTTTQPLVQFQYLTGGVWTNIGNPRVVPTNTLHKWDFLFTFSATVGDCRAYVDGVLLGQLTGNTAPTAPANLAEVRWHNQGVNFASNGVWLSEVQILDTSTLGRRLATLYLTGTGTTDAWTPSTGAASVDTVDEAGTYADTDYASSPTANQIYTGVTSDLSLTAQQYAVDSVVIAYRALRGATGPQNLQGVVRVGGTNYASGVSVAGLVTNMGYTWDAFDLNPATSAAWTPTQLNTAGFETGAKSIT